MLNVPVDRVEFGVPSMRILRACCAESREVGEWGVEADDEGVVAIVAQDDAGLSLFICYSEAAWDTDHNLVWPVMPHLGAGDLEPIWSVRIGVERHEGMENEFLAADANLFDLATAWVVREAIRVAADARG